MQSSEGGTESPASVALRPAAAAQPVPASPQRVLVQAAGSTPKGAPMHPLTLPRVQPLPQQVQHVYPAQVQYVEGGDAVYTNGAIRAAYAYNPDPQLYAPSSAASYFETPGGAQVTVAASSPPAVPSHGVVGISMDVSGTPIVSGTGAYLIHGGMDGTRHSLAHTARSSPATLEMAIENLQNSEGLAPHKGGLLNSHPAGDLSPVSMVSLGWKPREQRPVSRSFHGGKEMRTRVCHYGNAPIKAPPEATPLHSPNTGTPLSSSCHPDCL